MRLAEQQWQAVKDRTRRAVLDWLGITPANLAMETATDLMGTKEMTALNAGKGLLTTIIPGVSCPSAGVSRLDTGTATVLDFTSEAVTSTVIHISQPFAQALVERCEKI